MNNQVLGEQTGRGKWVWWCVFASLICAIFALLYFFYLLSPASLSGGLHQFEISRGATIQEIAARLVEGRIVRSAAGFKLYAILSGSAHRLKPGGYALNEASTTPEIVRILVEGPPADIPLLITEGESLRDIEKKLNALRVLKEGNLTNAAPERFSAEYPFLEHARSLEGFLFPDTYRFGASSSPETVVRKFLDNFASQAMPLFTGREESLRKALTFASFLEREIPLGDDRRLVAGIFERRLRLGMPFQVDATLLYAKCGGGFKDCPSLLRSDFSIDSPFNTYRYRGLPPTPIANPGLDAIRAALDPEPSRFLYYLSDPETGRTVFSETIDIHNRNRARYLTK